MAPPAAKTATFTATLTATIAGRVMRAMVTRISAKLEALELSL